jgi:hypothetical protein
LFFQADVCSTLLQHLYQHNAVFDEYPPKTLRLLIALFHCCGLIPQQNPLNLRRHHLQSHPRPLLHSKIVEDVIDTVRSGNN